MPATASMSFFIVLLPLSIALCRIIISGFYQLVRKEGFSEAIFAIVALKPNAIGSNGGNGCKGFVALTNQNYHFVAQAEIVPGRLFTALQVSEGQADRTSPRNLTANFKQLIVNIKCLYLSLLRQTPVASFLLEQWQDG